MRIVRLEAEHFKRLTAVDITPDGTLQVIAGRNAQGKTSVLDAIWWVLQARGAKVETPVHDGADTATVRLTFEDFVVTRTTSGSGTGKLTITSRDGGASYNSPQSMLDKLVGKLSLDPLAFANSEAKKQVEVLQGLVALPFDPTQLAAQRKALYDQRTDVGRDRDKAQGVFASIPVPAADVPADQVSAADLVAQLQRAEQVEREFQAASSRYTEITRQIELLQRELVEVTERGHDLAKMRMDPEPIRRQLAELDEINARVLVRQQREHAGAEYDRLAEQYGDLSNQIDRLDNYRREALAAVQMPVVGLGFTEDGITYNGQPFSQASGAERLRVSAAIAMAQQPEIRVLRIADGSLMDDDSMAIIAGMAAEKDYQVWVEVVGDGRGVGVVIEDGEVRA